MELYRDFGKAKVPFFALGIGVMAKLIINLILIPIPDFGINGAAIGSLVCNIIACLIGYIVLIKTINFNFSFIKYILKPIIATIVMGLCSYSIYISINGERLAIIISIIIAIITYGISIFILRIFTRDEFEELTNSALHK